MATQWKNVFVEVPDTDRTTWIVRLPFFDTPRQADYSVAGASWTWNDSNGVSEVLGAPQVFKWRDL